MFDNESLISGSRRFLQDASKESLKYRIQGPKIQVLAEEGTSTYNLSLRKIEAQHGEDHLKLEDVLSYAVLNGKESSSDGGVSSACLYLPKYS